MRQIFTIPLIAVASQSAHAHVLDDQEGPISQLLHQLVGTHHLPFTLLLLVIAVIFIRKWRAANSDR